MDEVYVYNNPGNMTFNSYLYVFVRAWYTLDGVNDTWFKVPAFRSDNTNHYICINPNMESAGMLIVAADTGFILKSQQNTKVNKTVSSDVLASIEKSAFDISAWEREHQSSYPYADMFERTKIKERYVAKFGSEAPNYDAVMDTNYRLVKRTVAPPARCGGCGRKRSRV